MDSETTQLWLDFDPGLKQTDVQVSLVDLVMSTSSLNALLPCHEGRIQASPYIHSRLFDKF